MPSSRLEDLSAQISEQTKVVNDYLVTHGHNLSFAVDSALSFPNDAPEEVLVARRTVREATKELHDLMTGAIRASSLACV